MPLHIKPRLISGAGSKSYIFREKDSSPSDHEKGIIFYDSGELHEAKPPLTQNRKPIDKLESALSLYATFLYSSIAL